MWKGIKTKQENGSSFVKHFLWGNSGILKALFLHWIYLFNQFYEMEEF